MRLKEIIDRALACDASDTGTAKAFLDAAKTTRYAIGKNQETLTIQSLVGLDGIIDDYAAPGTCWHGIPLLHTDNANKNAYVVNCSTSIRPVDTLRHLQASGFRHVVNLSDLVTAAGGALAQPEFVTLQRNEMEGHLDVWQTIHDALEDDVSRKTLIDVLLFRLTADIAHVQDYSVRIHEQYFEEFMGYGNEIFVDAGGFDGDTAEEFAKRYPDYRKILLFEPSAHNMALARRRLSGVRDITFFPFGLSNVAGRLRFNQQGGSASSVSDSGDDEIVVDALDSMVAEPVSVIKMDLEGWELPALEGCHRHIAEDRPKLAIAAYHKASDLRRIYQFVDAFGHDYRMFLRHYTQGWSETVLFFVPKD